MHCIPLVEAHFPRKALAMEATIVRTCFDKNTVWVHYNAPAVTSQVLFW